MTIHPVLSVLTRREPVDMGIADTDCDKCLDFGGTPIVLILYKINMEETVIYFGNNMFP